MNLKLCSSIMNLIRWMKTIFSYMEQKSNQIYSSKFQINFIWFERFYSLYHFISSIYSFMWSLNCTFIRIVPTNKNKEQQTSMMIKLFRFKISLYIGIDKVEFANDMIILFDFEILLILNDRYFTVYIFQIENSCIWWLKCGR